MRIDSYTADYIRELLPELLEADLTGSRAICPASLTDNQNHDYDWVVLMPNLQDAVKVLRKLDFTDHDASTAPSQFSSMRRRDLNLIITDKKEFYDKFMLATRTATRLGLNLKAQRIQLFQAILHQKG